jgi:hypothetical protein
MVVVDILGKLLSGVDGEEMLAGRGCGFAERPI